MKVRIQLRRPRGSSVSAGQRKLAQTAAAFMMPAALGAYALGCWRIAADLQWTGEFAISGGIFSHWQVWLALGAGIHGTGIALARLGRGGGAHAG